MMVIRWFSRKIVRFWTHYLPRFAYYGFLGWLLLTAGVCNRTALASATPAAAPLPTANAFSPHQPLSFNFRNIPVRDMLQLLAHLAGVNMVIDDTVQGNLTVYLQKVSWQQALDTILIMKNLAAHREGNVLFIAPVQELASQTQQQLQQQNLNTFLLTLHYASAVNMANLLRSADSGLLSPRGHVQADPRTNTLWVTDIPQNVASIRRFVANLDIPIKQVLIKARIVSIDDSFVRELGLQFGTIPSQTSSSARGRRNEPDDLAEDLTPSLQYGQFNIAIAKVGLNSLLDLQLTALESEGHARIISSPELLTADHNPADIEEGDEIPYQEKTSSGATSVSFKKAVLSLKVTPQVTSQNRILLNLVVNQDKVSSTLINGVPAIQTHAVQTQVLVRDGQTLVLGGIYEQSQHQNVLRTPILGSLPLVGRLFRDHHTDSKRNQLLIFVTPQVMQ